MVGLHSVGFHFFISFLFVINHCFVLADDECLFIDTNSTKHYVPCTDLEALTDDISCNMTTSECTFIGDPYAKCVKCWSGHCSTYLNNTFFQILQHTTDQCTWYCNTSFTNFDLYPAPEGYPCQNENFCEARSVCNYTSSNPGSCVGDITSGTPCDDDYQICNEDSDTCTTFCDSPPEEIANIPVTQNLYNCTLEDCKFQYECASNTSAVYEGGGTITCGHLGEWEGDVSPCTQQCPSIPPPVFNDSVTMEQTCDVEGCTLTYQCAYGYAGGGSFKCTLGQWEINTLPMYAPCRRDCGEPADQAHSDNTFDCTIEDCEAEYKCHDHYNGGGMKVCGSNGIWNGDAQCINENTFDLELESIWTILGLAFVSSFLVFFCIMGGVYIKINYFPTPQDFRYVRIVKPPVIQTIDKSL